MMLQLKVIWYSFNLCAIAFAWTVRGSTGFTTFAFSVEEQKLGYIPSAAPFLNGSTIQPPLTSHPFESSPPGPEHLPSAPTVSPTQSAVAPSTKNPPSPGTSIKISPSTEPPSSTSPPPPQVPLHDLAPQKPTQVHAPPPVVLPPHNVTPSPPVVSPQASVPIGVPSHVPQPPVTPSHVFAPPPLVSPPTSATTPPSTTPPAISPSISSLSPPVLPLPSSVAPPPLPSKYASPPSIVAMPPQTTPTHSKAPNHLASPSPLLEVMPLAVPSHEFGSPPAMPPKPRAPSQSSAPPPQVIPSDVTAPPHPSATPPITLPSHVLVPPPFKKSQVLASPPIYMPNVSAPPPNSTMSKHPSTQSPLPAPTHVSNPPPIVLSPPLGAVPSHDLAPPPTHTPYISAPPPNAIISQQSPAPLPPTPPIRASNPPPRVMSPIVSSPPPDAAPSHNLASSPPPESHFSAPPPNATISQHSSAPLPPTPPMNATNTPPRGLVLPPFKKSQVLASPPIYMPNVSAPPPNSTISKHPSTQSPLPAPTHVSNPPPIVLSPPPGAVPSHDLARPPTHTPYISAPPPNATISQQSPAPLPPTPPIRASNPPPRVMSPIVSSPPPDTAPSHNLASSPPPESHFSAPPPNATISQHSSAPLPPTPPMNATNTPPRGLVLPPFKKSQVLASPPIYMPNVSAPPPNSTISKHPSTQSPLPAPTHVSNPPPIVLSPPPGAVPSHDLAPPPTHTPYISAPPPNATISQQSPAPLPPTPPIRASNPPPRVMSPIVSSPPPDAAPSHNLASSPPPESHFSAPPPNATISQHSSAPLLPTPPMNATNTPPRAMSPIVSLPPPAPSHDLAPSSAESHFSAPPPSSKHNFSTPPTSSPTSINASNPPSSSVSSHASAPSTAAEPPFTASPPSIHTLPSGSLPPVTSNSSAPLAAPPVRSPSFDPVVPRESPSIPTEARLPRVSSPAPSIDQRGHQVPVHVAPSGPTYPLSPTNDHPEQGFSPSIAPSTHKSRDQPSVAPVATISPPISPTAEAAHSPSFSPLPSTNKTHHQRDSSHFAPETSYTVPSSSPKQQGQVESPHSLLAPAPESTQRYLPPTSYNPGSSADMAPSQSPSTENYISPVPMSAIPDPSGRSMTPFLSPKISPSGYPTREPNIELAPPILALPPPPPNHDCLSYTCLEPYTNTIPGSPCGCVLPMKVELQIGVALYTFFPLVPELAREIATGIFMKQSQVRIMGANAASEQPEKTLLLIDLVPLGEKFDNITAFLIYERFWNKKIAISKSLFGDYEVLYVQYQGLPPSPPTAPSDIADINGGAYPGNNGSKIHPLGVDVTKKGRKHRLSGSLIAIIVFSAVGAVFLCLLLGWILLFRHRRHVNQSSEAPHIYPVSAARSTGPTGQSIGSRPSFSLSFESSVAAYTGSAKTFSASEIEKATDNFNLSRVLGEGGFGRVYSGVLEDGTEVAVKVLKREDQQGGREFLAEIEMLSRLHHRNLVKLIGICVEEHVRCLIYELIRNGSVESHLHGIDKESSPLDWAARMRIALGAARGLAYLHEDSSPRVIHRDFKGSNILLETDFTPKVSDFGLAKTAMDEENRHISTRVMGTFGYVAPEYAMTGHLLVKSDVYSYGVVLLELLTGRKPVDMSQPPGQENLVAWTRPYLTTKEALKSIIDLNLGPDISFDSVAKVAAIASMCVQPEVSHRPFMGEVVQALKLVCNECDDAKDELGESPRSENLPLDRDVEKALSASDVFSGMETGLGCKESGSGSFPRHSSSGPIGGGRSWRFWKRGRTTSSREDVVGENGLYRFWSGSH